jgi:hypothetical protein
VGLVPEADVLPVLREQADTIRRLVASLSPEGETFRYAAGKWSVREMLGHIGDGERVFGYRALCVSRGDQASLPGFDQDDYIATAGFDTWTAAELAEDFARLRASTIALLEHLPAARWSQTGTANGKRITVRALAYVMAGHVRHHLGVLRERYSIGA